MVRGRVQTVAPLTVEITSPGVGFVAEPATLEGLPVLAAGDELLLADDPAGGLVVLGRIA